MCGAGIRHDFLHHWPNAGNVSCRLAHPQSKCRGLSLGFALSFALVAYLSPDFYQILLNFDLITHEQVAEWSGLRVKGQKLMITINTVWAWPVTVFLTWGCGLLIPASKNEEALFPTPAKLEITGKSSGIPSEIIAFCKSEDLQAGMIPWIEKLGIQRTDSSDLANLIIEKDDSPHSEAYRLTTGTDSVRIEAKTSAGTFRGLSTLAQLIEQAEGEKIAGIYIEDQPELNRRGFMLDISRCKVPTMKELFALIDLIARLGYNELQLYVEHTFAFKDHQTIWKNASPLTALKFSRSVSTQERFIELVPNLNSFGHFERWLCHDKYKHMAECPDGFIRKEPYIKRDHGTTLRPNDESLTFIDSSTRNTCPLFPPVNLMSAWTNHGNWARDGARKRWKKLARTRCI